LLNDGDILFSAKGTKNFAFPYCNKNIPAVASTSFFVIHLQQKFQKIIPPQFLAWLINHPTSQKYLKSHAIGTSMVSISKAVLGDLEISLPSIEMQQKILEISHLQQKEKKIVLQIKIFREKQIQQQLFNSLK